MSFQGKKIVETDVLVLGSGLAGLRAAIEARRYGVNVLLVDKSVIGLNTNTRFSGSGFRAADTLEHTRVREIDLARIHSAEEHFRDTCRHGEYLNDQLLAEILCYDGPTRVWELEGFGVKLTGAKAPYPHGDGIVRPLRDTCKAMGVKTRVRTVVFDLIRSEDSVVGAVGFDLATREFLVFKAKSTIIATGEATEIFERNNVTATTTGDGYAMAYRAGAELLDMEIVLFDPNVISEPNLPMLDRRVSIAGSYAFLRNKLGEAFLRKYIPLPGPHAALGDGPVGMRVDDLRELMSRAMALEVHEGRGDEGAVFYDARHVPEKRWHEDLGGEYTLNVLFRGFDVEKEMIHVFPGAVCNLGGIKINGRCETDVEGLYAAGMVTGGVHGAGRLSGNALTDCVVFGVRAGRSAAIRALSVEVPETNVDQVEEKERFALEILERPPKKEGDPRELIKQLKSTMWENAGVLRSEEGLETAIGALNKIEEENASSVFASGVRRLRDSFDLINMLAVAQMVARAALMREESRGAHYRLDFPFRDDKNWLKNITIRRENGGMTMRTRPVKTNRMPREPHSEYLLEVRD